jgi:hypothetical protein
MRQQQQQQPQRRSSGSSEANSGSRAEASSGRSGRIVDPAAGIVRAGVWAAARGRRPGLALLEVPFSRQAGFELPLEADLNISVSHAL